MAKNSGGTRNYRNNPKALSTRRREFEGLMSSGFYDISRSYFDPSGDLSPQTRSIMKPKILRLIKKKRPPYFSPTRATKCNLTANVLQ